MLLSLHTWSVWLWLTAAFLAGTGLSSLCWWVHLRSFKRSLSQSEDQACLLVEQLEASRASLREAEHELIRLQTEHTAGLEQLREMRDSVPRMQEQMRTQFEELAQRVLAHKEASLQQDNQRSLDALLTPLRVQLQGFQQRVNQVHDESLRGQTALALEVQRMLSMGLSMSEQAHSLAQALRGDNKQMGTWGEIQLQRTLEMAGLVQGLHYDTQAPLRDEQGRLRMPDFLVHLPEKKCLIIDSKVSLVDYERAMQAPDEPARQQALKLHVQSLKRHIDDLAGKEYSVLAGAGSPDFVFMYVPIEAAYMQGLQHQADLYEYGVRKNVLLVSHTTLLPVLRMVSTIWVMVRSNEQAQSLSERAGEIYNQVSLLAERVKKLGETLGQANRHYNHTVTALAGQQGLYGKVSRFAEVSASAKRAQPQLTALDRDIEHEKLDVLLTDQCDPSDPAA